MFEGRLLTHIHTSGSWEYEIQGFCDVFIDRKEPDRILLGGVSQFIPTTSAVMILISDGALIPQ